MAWHGKAIGAGLGTVVGGPVGTVIGGWVGHIFDHDAEERERLNEQALAAAQAENEARLTVFAVYVSAAHVDGVIHPNERRRLKSLAEGLLGNIDNHEINQWIDDIDVRRFSAAECAEVLRSLPVNLHAIVVRDVMSVFCADDDFNPAEAQWMQEFVYRAGFDPALWNFLYQCFCRDSADSTIRARHLSTLGLPLSATEEDVRRAYRKLAPEYHPDRHHGVSKALRDLAEQRLKEINEAHHSLTRTGRGAVLQNHAALVSNRTPQDAATLHAGNVVMCGLCETRNRLPSSEQHAKARCGLCFALLMLPRQVIDSLAER